MTTFDFDLKFDIIDSATPSYNPLSGRYKKSLAYYTLSERYPEILSRVVEHLNKDKNEIAGLYSGKETLEEIESLVISISKLKQKLLNNKRIETFSGEEPDKELWNDFIKEMPTDLRSFFHANWLYSECYIFRKLSSFFENSKTLKNFDYFAKQKQNILKNFALLSIVKSLKKSEKNFNTFEKLIKLSLWSNKCDLNAILPKEFQPNETLLKQIDTFNDKLLINDSEQIWQCLESADRSKPVIVEFISDNAGFELFTDLILADYLLDKQMASVVRFSVKAIPWFVSDVIPNDIFWLLDHLNQQESLYVKRLAIKWKQNFKELKFIISPLHYYWVSPYEYYKMRELAPDLYQYLAEACLVIFKGDLNYRKLLGDTNWDPSDELITCVRGFRPTNFCTLRTIKSDLICGLSQGKAEQLLHLDNRWMLTADYGVIQFMEGRYCDCQKKN